MPWRHLAESPDQRRKPAPRRPHCGQRAEGEQTGLLLGEQLADGIDRSWASLVSNPLQGADEEGGVLPDEHSVEVRP